MGDGRQRLPSNPFMLAFLPLSQRKAHPSSHHVALSQMGKTSRAANKGTTGNTGIGSEKAHDSGGQVADPPSWWSPALHAGELTPDLTDLPLGKPSQVVCDYRSL